MELNEQLNKFLEEAVKETFKNTFSVDPNSTNDDFNSINEECLISTIGFAGLIEGNFSIITPDKNACQIVSKMLLMEIDKLSSDVIDGMGEIINMIAGSVKMKIPESKYHYTLSIPTSIKGSRMVILADADKTNRITKNFIFEDVKFSVALIYKMHDENSFVSKKKDSQKINSLDALSKLNSLADLNACSNPLEEAVEKSDLAADALDRLNKAIQKTKENNH